MTENISINRNQEIEARSYEYIAGVFSRCGLYDHAAKNYHTAALRYQATGQSDKSTSCRHKWFLSEIGVAC